MFSLRTLRLRLAWVLLPPFLILATPTAEHILVGVVLAVPGLILRILASGYIDKDRSLATCGPYARLRHPLYLGSFVAGLGLVVAAGRTSLLLAYLILFPLLYGPAIRAEEAEMERRFGGYWRRYRRRVPAVVPGLRSRQPGLDADPAGPGTMNGYPWGTGSGTMIGSPAPGAPKTFQTSAFRRNRPLDGVLGVLTGFFVLWLKMRLFS